MSNLLSNHLQYNVWANTKLGEYLAQLDNAIFDQPAKSSFSSIRKTVKHIWDAESIWFSRIKGNTVAVCPSDSYAGNVSQLIKDWLACSKEFADFFSDKGEDELAQIINYKTLKGQAFESSLADIVLHAVNHGTFHRGQLITMLRALGYTDLPATDFIAFSRIKMEVRSAS